MTADVDAPPSRFGLGGAYALAFLTLIYAFNYFDRQLLGLLLPKIKADLHLTDTALGLVSGAAFVLCYSVAGVPIARLADRISRRNIIGVGFLFWSFATAATGLVQSVSQLAILRFLTGAGEAAGIAPSNAMAADIAPPNRRPLALGILTSGNAVAGIILFPIAGFLVDHHGWRATYLLAGGAGMVLAVLFAMTVPEPARTGQHTEGRLSFLAALRRLRRSPTFVASTIGGALMGISLYSTQLWSPAFFERIHGLSMTQIGATVGPVRGITSLFGGIAGGWLTSRLAVRDPRYMLWVPATACILMLPAEILFLYAPSLYLSLVGYAASGLLSTLHLAPVYAALIAIVSSDMRATVVATFLLIANLVGQIVGPLLVGYLNDLLYASMGVGAIRIGLVAGALCAACGGFAFLIASRTVRSELE